MARESGGIAIVEHRLRSLGWSGLQERLFAGEERVGDRAQAFVQLCDLGSVDAGGLGDQRTVKQDSRLASRVASARSMLVRASSFFC